MRRGSMPRLAVVLLGGAALSASLVGCEACGPDGAKPSVAPAPIGSPGPRTTRVLRRAREDASAVEAGAIGTDTDAGP